MRGVEARRVRVAYRALRTRELRERVLVDMAVQVGAGNVFYVRPEVRVMVEAALPSLLDDSLGLVEACDLRALAREAAVMRLERAEAGVLPWPRVGWVWWRVWNGRPGF